jgi:acetate---CoA ligase (ADP-forming)
MEHRAAYDHRALERLIDPKTVAIVGLSRNETSFGARTAFNLRNFSGQAYGVNPKAEELHGLACFPSISALPEPIDCAVIAVPIDAVEAAVEDCAAIGAGGCIIYASGFAETGRPDRIALQTRLAAIARSSRLRIVGPNCFGLINNTTRAGLSFSSGYAVRLPRIGSIGIVSQSGGIGQAIAQVAERGGAYSHFMAAGNSCDVDVCDYVSYLADDPSCEIIICVAEGLVDGERFLEAGQRALSAGKPIVMYKIATGGAAARAAMSHTGALSGSNEALQAACRRLGVILVENIEDVYETASFLAKAGRPKAVGVAVMAASGGACVIALDKAERFNVSLPMPAPHTQCELERTIPDFGHAGNPCDITAQVATNPTSYAACAEALLADPAYGALLVMTPTIIPTTTERNVDMFSRLATQAGKPVCVSWISEWKDGPGAAKCEADARVARFTSTERAFRTFASWYAREEALKPRPPSTRHDGPNPAAARARQLLAEAGERLTEREAKSVIETYAVPVAIDQLVLDADAAVAAAARIGYPVVLKAESPDIPHKTELGVVHLGLSDARAVRVAYAAIRDSLASLNPAPRVTGISVQPMVPPGIEIVVGTRRDPTFGPVVVVGFGGTLVELLRDSTTELGPVDHHQALGMLSRLRSANLLTGFRGSAPINLDRVANIIVALSELAVDLADVIDEIDVNPIICGADQAVAVDALIIRR